MYRSWNTCCDPWFFRRMWKLSFLTILYAQENLKGCVPWALQRKSTDGFSCYAKYLIFTDTSWTEILHVVARIPFYSFVQASGFPLLNGKKKWVSMFHLQWRASTFNKDKGWILHKKLLWQLPWGDCYKQKKEVWRIKKSV